MPETETSTEDRFPRDSHPRRVHRTPAAPPQRRFPRPPDGPPDLGGRSWFAVMKRTVKEFREDNLTDWAAALTYYAVLALFPAIIALVSIVGLAGKSATDTLIKNVETVTSGPARNVLTNAFTGLSANRGTAGALFVLGIV